MTDNPETQALMQAVANILRDTRKELLGEIAALAERMEQRDPNALLKSVPALRASADLTALTARSESTMLRRSKQVTAGVTTKHVAGAINAK